MSYDMVTEKKIRYWQLQKEDLLKELHSSEIGLDEAEAIVRLKEFGPNEIPHSGHRPTIQIFLSQFRNPLVYVLIFASILAGLLGEATEAIIILAIMLVNALLGFAQEYRSEKALHELRKYLSYEAVALRNGRKRSIDTRMLVPGDIVFMAIGDVIPAEIRLLETNGFQTNESVLTGESTPVDKTTEPIGLDEPLPHQLSNIALMGSTVANGSGKGIVVTTGKQSYFGQIASSLSDRVR